MKLGDWVNNKKISGPQFHVYSLCVNAHLALCASKHFQQGQGPCRGLLRDCETYSEGSFAALVGGAAAVSAGVRAVSS